MSPEPRCPSTTPSGETPDATPFRSPRAAPAARLLALALAVAAPRPVFAQDEKPAAPPVPEQHQQQFEEMLRQTEALGPWEKQAALNEEAAALFFERQGWTSEPDLFARNVLRDVDRVPPWKPQERMSIFLNSVQGRYGLTENQKSELNRNFQMEAMRITITHFKDMAPIAMEVLKTRAAGEPFTAEQVARWSRATRPLLADARAMIERVSSRLAQSMTPEQRKLLDADVRAFFRRHDDVVRAVARWERGEWDPTEWGLDNDPAHAAVMAELRARNAARPAPGAAMEVPRRVDDPARPEDESSWERYVREFCAVHAFDSVQTQSARGILSEQTTRAKNFRKSHAAEIAALEAAFAHDADPARRDARRAELQALLAPIHEMFLELKQRLEELMTAEQRDRAAGRAGPAPPATQPAASVP